MAEGPQQVRFVEYDQGQSEQTVQETPPFRVHSNCVLSVPDTTGRNFKLTSIFHTRLSRPHS